MNYSIFQKTYNDKILFEDLTLNFSRSDIVALIGENGTGKTTLLNIIAGSEMPGAGAINYFGNSIGYVPQELSASGEISGIFSEDQPSWQIERALELVGLGVASLHYLIEDLSGGQKTRLSLARVLATEFPPDILLLDEPTNNIDADGLVWLEKFVKSYKYFEKLPLPAVF